MPHEIRVVDRGTEGGRHADALRLDIDGAVVEAELAISKLSRALVSNLSPILADLLEVAACVYVADAALSRGGTAARQMGVDWRRDLRFEIPVRCPEVWSRPEIGRQLAETLGFLSEDTYDFTFTPHDGRALTDTFQFEFGPEEGWRADEVILFSGGLDSFAGAAEAVIERQKRVALVSHYSSQTMAKPQNDLAKAIGVARPGAVRHFCMRARLKGRGTKEGTHRSRSFLLAALALAVAGSFARSDVAFYENGAVSLNLPPLPQFVGARATRSTHPRALADMSALFSALLDAEVSVVNPYFLRTKRDVVEIIARLGLHQQLRHTRSCANVRIASKMLPHCGRCSQCIDRRFAVLSAGLGAHDPHEPYAVDLLDGPRRGPDRELVLAYVRMARLCRFMTGEQLLQRYPEIVRALDVPGREEALALGQYTQLMNRHGSDVTEVIEKALKTTTNRNPDSLLALYAADDWAPSETIAGRSGTEDPPRILIELDTTRRRARIGETLLLDKTAFRSLATLAEQHLSGLGDGLAPEDFPMLQSTALLELWDLAEEGTVRRRIKDLRGKLEAGLGTEAADIIETLPWHGYRLKPERVVVRKADLSPTANVRTPPA